MIAATGYSFTDLSGKDERMGGPTCIIIAHERHNYLPGQSDQDAPAVPLASLKRMNAAIRSLTYAARMSASAHLHP